MNAIAHKPAPTHREVTPIRVCRSCDCYLSSVNPRDTCFPCSTPESELDDAEVFHRIARIPDVRLRQKAFEAYAELQFRSELTDGALGEMAA